MADLGSLMQVAPYAGGFMAGQRNTSTLATEDVERQKLAALIEGIKQQNQQSQVMNPLLAEHQRLQNQNLEAGIPGTAADSRTKVAQADFKEGTLKSDIQAAIAKNDGDRAKAAVDVNTAVGQMFGRAGAYLNTIPNDSPGRRAIALQEYMSKQGISTESPMYQQLMGTFSKIPSDKLPAALTQYGAKVLQDNERFQQSKYTADTAAASHAQTTKMNNQTQLDLEDKRIAAGKYDKNRLTMDVQSALIKYGHNPTATAEIYNNAALAAQAAGDERTAAAYTAAALDARKRVAEDARNKGVAQPRLDVPAAANQGVIQNNEPPAANAPVGIGGQGQGGPAAAGQAQVPNAAHIDYLRKNPSEKAAFDRKFGAGAADRALQGK